MYCPKPNPRAVQSLRTDLEVVLLDHGLDGGAGDVPARLHMLYLDMKDYCKKFKIPLHMSDLTRTLLSFSTATDFPCGFLGYS